MADSSVLGSSLMWEKCPETWWLLLFGSSNIIVFGILTNKLLNYVSSLHCYWVLHNSSKGTSETQNGTERTQQNGMEQTEQ